MVAKTTRSRLGYAGWGFADQAMSSLSNFGVGLVAARASTAEEFGAFSIAFATSVLGVGISRALVGEVYSVRYSGGGPTISAASGLDPDSGPDPDGLGELLEAESEMQGLDASDGAGAPESEERYPQVAGTLGIALVLGLLAGLACAMAALVASGSLRGALFVLAVGMPFLVVQDVTRFVCITRRDAFGATVSDTVWVVGFVAAIAVLHVTQGGFPSANGAMGAWVVGAAFGALAGCVRLHALPRLVRGLDFGRVIWRQSTRYFLDWLALGATVQLAYYVLGFTAGLAVVGEYRAAMLLAGPLNIVLMGAVMLLVPELTRYRRRTGDRLLKLTVAISVVLIAISVAWIGIVAVLPDTVLVKLLGDAASSAQPLLPYVLLWLVTAVLAQGPLVSLRATGDVRRGTRASIPAAPFQLFALAIGAAVIGGAEGALVGAAAANVVAGILATYHLIVATRRGPIEFVDEAPVEAVT
ncbi:MAG TPA: hypothetical protein VIY72_01035 [Acidimicrobiales bacterium]